jgi:hypothetical protein
VPEGQVCIEFSFQPRNFAAFDALYVVKPQRRAKIGLLLGVAVGGGFAGIAFALAGSGAGLWLTCLAIAVLSLGVLVWWALSQLQGSPFATGPGSVVVDDHGLLVRPTYSPQQMVEWSTLRGWARTEKFIVLLPKDPAGRPLHIIPLDSFGNEHTLNAFKDLVRWHLGKPK